MSRVRKGGHHGSKPKKVGVAEDGRTIWECRVRCGLNERGKPRDFKEKFIGTEQEATDHTELMWRTHSNEPSKIGRISLSEYFYEHFIPERLNGSPQKTKKDYISIFKKHIEPFFGARNPDDIPHREIQQWIYGIKPPNDQKVYRHFRAIVRAMFDDDFLGDIKPLQKRIKFGRCQKKRKDVWSADELLEAMERLRGHTLERVFLVMGGGGLRREEAMALIAPNDFTFEYELTENGPELVCYIDVTKAFTNDDGIKDEKTYSPYTVAIMPPFSNRLKELMPEEPEPLVVCKRNMKLEPNDPRLFPGCSQASMWPNTASKLWNASFEASWVSTRTRNGKVTSVKEMPAGPLYGMRFINFNNLRHTHATLTLQGGANVAVSARAHGHDEAVEYRNYFADHGTALEAAKAFTAKVNRSRA